jgi:hypothetical protein
MMFSKKINYSTLNSECKLGGPTYSVKESLTNMQFP